MEYNIKSKPTIYNKQRYRSRLEARVACFFDRIGWRHSYEPFDLDGWTPDFAVYGTDNRMLLVEVKPFIDDDIISQYFEKVNKSKHEYPCILLDVSFDSSSGYISAGVQLNNNLKPDFYLAPYSLAWKNNQLGLNSEYDIGSLEMAFDGMLWNDVENRKIFIGDYEQITLTHHWYKAGEIVTFKFYDK
jgi:hypothetical protein